MRPPRISIGLLALVLMAAGRRPGTSNEPISLETLLKEMVTRDHLARFPEPAYTCRQFSSYDRDTVSRAQSGWYANWDRSQFIRTEENSGRTEHVLMDTEGPGAVVRFWGTWHGPRGGPFTNGTLRIYLDHSPEPVIEGPMADVISGGALLGPPLSGSVSPDTNYAQRGHNLYLPIPYARHCKITYETKALIDRGAKKGEALYYQINYRTYAKGTSVRSFSNEEIAKLRPTIDKTQTRLMRSGLTDEPLEGTVDFTGTVAPAATHSVTTGGGPAAIRRLSVKLEAEDLEQALRSTVLEISFDGNPAVWCPVGDFFGVGYRRTPYKTWYTEVTPEGVMTCYWVMPFEKTCRLTIHNLGEQEVRVASGQALTGKWAWDSRSLHFHSTWRQYTRIPTGPNKDMTGRGAYDINYVEVHGKGQYVGDTLTLFNGTDAWWGEGDEKIFVDREQFPSHVGTGTEDYYGYAWCKPAAFAMPFHAQPDGSGNLRVGFSVNSRYRALDAIPFKKTIRFDMEMWHWRGTRMNYAPSTFWYARPGAKWNVAPDPQTASLKVAREEGDVVEIFEVFGALEGESLRVVEFSGGTTEIQRIGQFGWSGNGQLWWRDGKPGDKLVLEVPVPKAGRYRLRANLTKAPDYGIVRISIDGQAAGSDLDRYATEVKHDLLDLGTFDLKEGVRRVVVEITGSHPEAIKKHMFGLDYLLLELTE